MGISVRCQQCREPLEEWEARICEGCGMTKSEAKRYAREVVSIMLHGRCCPETEDVDDITDDQSEQELIIDEITKILIRLRKLVEPQQR